MFADGCHWNNTLLYVDEILVSGFITWLSSSLHLFSRGRVFWRAAGESNPGKYCAKIHLGMCSFFLISLGCFPAFPTSIFFAAFHARTCVCVCVFLFVPFSSFFAFLPFGILFAAYSGCGCRLVLGVLESDRAADRAGRLCGCERPEGCSAVALPLHWGCVAVRTPWGRRNAVLLSAALL